MKVGGVLLGGALVVAALAATGGAIGCSLLVDTDSLAGVSPSPADAGEDGGVAIQPAEASVAGDGSGSPADPCSSDLLFCETFDNDADPLARYTLNKDPTTAITIDSARSLSAPHSAKFVINVGPNTSPDATIAYRIEGDKKPDFVFEAAFFIEREENLFARLLRITINNAGPILLERNGLFKIDTTQLANIGRVPSNVWVHLRLEVHPTTMTLSLTTPDGVGNVTSGPVNVAPAWTSGPIYFRVGIAEANSPNTGWVVYWDDIVVRPL